MSRGHGHVQRAVLAMIEAEPHGAWTIEDICRRAYRGVTVEKKHRVAVLRAVKRMKLPGDWGAVHPWCLCDTCDDESQERATHAVHWRRSMDFESWRKEWSHVAGKAREAAAKERKWRDASQVEKIGMQIDLQKQMIGYLSIGGTASANADIAKSAKRIAELTAERELIATESVAA